MAKEMAQVFASHTDHGHEGPENLERPGEMGRALLNKMQEEWEEEMMMSAITVEQMKTLASFDGKQVKGLLRNWRDFRKYLLTLHNTRGSIKFDAERFGTPQHTIEALKEGMRRMGASTRLPSNIVSAMEGSLIEPISGVVPMQLAAWVRGSQRIFSLSQSAIDKCSKAVFGDRTWEDILMPFDSFVIELQAPIARETESGRATQIRALLITDLSKIDPEFPKGYFECRPLVTDSEGKIADSYFSGQERKYIKRFLRGKYSEEVTTATMNAATRKWRSIKAAAFQPFHIAKDELITSDDISPITNQLRNIIAGTCLHLLKKKPKDGGIEPPPPWPPLKGLKHMNVITDPAQVISIGHVHDFDLEPDISDIPREGGPVAPHHRRAFLRRPVGSPPHAPKTIPVKSTVVNRHLLPRDAIPQGTTTKIE